MYVADPAPSGSLIVLAGFAGEETDDMYVYDIASDTWRSVKLSGAPFTKRSVFAMSAISRYRVLVFMYILIDLFFCTNTS